MPTATEKHRSRNVALVALAIGGVVSILASAFSAAYGRAPEVFLPVGISGVAYAAAGALLIARRPDNLIGIMLLAAGVLPATLVLLRYMFPILVPLNVAFGAQANILPIAYLILGFPSGRLIGRAERWIFSAVMVVGLLGGVAELLTVEPRLALSEAAASPCTPCTSNPFRIFDPSFYPVLQDINGVAFLVVAAATFALVIRRWSSSRGLTRTALTPVMMGGIALALVYASLLLLALIARYEPPLAGQLLLITRLLIPIGLVAILLRFYAARSAVARDLLRMGRGTSVVRLENALRRVLRDPRLTVARWSPANGGYVGSAGDARAVVPDADQKVLSVTNEGEPVAVVVHDATLESDRELLEVVADSVRYTLEVSDLRDELTARGGDISRLPSGRVTFLFGDVERSTELVARLGDDWAGVLAALRELIRATADNHSGEIVDMRADECFLAFADARSAVRAALDLQAQIAENSWPAGVVLRLRIGLHTGSPELTPSGYVGIDVHRAARVMGAAQGGQIVASEAFANAIGDELPSESTLRPIGSFQLRGFPEEERLYVVADDR